MLSDLISSELPYLRRYARGLMGQQTEGDAAVEDMIESLIFRISVAPEIKFNRADLFAELDKTARKRIAALSDDSGIARILNAMSTEERRTLLLTIVEGFTIAETSKILGMTIDNVEDTLKTAETTITHAVSTPVLIIEDETLISYQLSQIVRDAGHTIAAVATTQGEAVEFARNGKFGLILSDIRLADGSTGIDAVSDIEYFTDDDVPVVYITAYPEMLLQGGVGEPAYLIPKPFDPLHVRTVIDQAVLSAYLADSRKAA